MKNNISGDHLESWVREALHPDQLAKAKKKLGRMKLTKGMVVIIWSLRVYVVVMALLIAVQIWNAFHAGGS